MLEKEVIYKSLNTDILHIIALKSLDFFELLEYIAYVFHQIWEIFCHYFFKHLVSFPFPPFLL